MKRITKILLAVVLLLVVLVEVAYYLWFRNPYPDLLQLRAAEVFRSADSPLAIRNATLIDVETGQTRVDTGILIVGGKITAVTANDSLMIPPGAREFNAEGRFIMPGLVDAHVHLMMHPHLLSGEFEPRDSLTTRVALEQFVRYGVTTVLAFGGGGSNDEQAAELKRMARSKEIVSPLLLATGDILTAPGSHPITTIMRMDPDVDAARLHKAGLVAVKEDANIRPAIRHKRELGLDGVKIIVESGPPPWYPKPRMSAQTVAEIVRLASLEGLPTYAHATSFDELADVVSADVRGVMHSIEDTLLSRTRIADEMRRKDIYLVPTLSVLHAFQTLEHPERLEDPYLIAGVSPRVIRSLENPLLRFGMGHTLGDFDLQRALEVQMQNLVFLYREGVQVAMGTDASNPFVFPGYGAHVEMELMVKAGLSPADVLRISTINGARLLEIDEMVGTVEPGRLANLLILNGNPLQDIRNSRTIEAVILEGALINDLPSADG